MSGRCADGRGRKDLPSLGGVRVRDAITMRVGAAIQRGLVTGGCGFWRRVFTIARYRDSVIGHRTPAVSWDG